MIKIREILIDGLILFAASTLLVIVADQGFSRLKGASAGESPLLTAIAQNDLAALREKLPASDPNHADAQGRPPLAWAAYANFAKREALRETDAQRTEIISLLLKNGADPNRNDRDGWSPLMWAAWSGLPRSAELLVRNGATATTRDRNGNSALSLAAGGGFPDLVRLLAPLDRSAWEEARSAAIAGKKKNPEEEKAFGEILSLLTE